MMHDWAFITPNSKKQVVIWRFEFLLVLSFMHNMLYFWKGALSFYTVDRRLGDRSAYASLFVFFWAPLDNLDECLKKHARPCTIKIKILTIPISLSSTSLITILSPLPDFMHLSVSSLLYHSHPPHPIYTKQHTTIKCPMCFSISDSLASTVSNCTVTAAVMPQRFQIHSNHGSCTTWNEISGRCPSDYFVLSFKEEMNIYFCWEITRYMMSLVSNFMTRVTEEICTAKILYTGRCSFDPEGIAEGRWNEIYNPKSF